MKYVERIEILTRAMKRAMSLVESQNHHSTCCQPGEVLKMALEGRRRDVPCGNCGYEG